MMLTGWLPPGWVAAAAPLEAGAVPMALIVALWLGMELTVTRTVLKAVAVLVVLDGQGLVGLTAGIVWVPLMGRMLMVTGCLDASGELLAVSEAVWDSSGREGLSAGTGRTVIVTGALLGAGVLSPWVTVTVSGSWGCC